MSISTLLQVAATLALAVPAASLSCPAPPPPLGNLNGTCWGQSCIVADAAGSSGLPYTARQPPKYATPSGTCCVVNYNPAVRARLYRQEPLLAAQCNLLYHVTPPHTKPPNVQSSDCRPKTLLYARGTNEPYPLGVIGQGLQAGLEAAEPGQWYVRDSNYTNDIPGVFCLGMEGGIKAKGELDAIASRCPNTKFVVGGYSQGAMVAREAVSNSTNGHRVTGIVTFGDPFNGAPVKNYNGGLRVYCVKGDRVCYGEPIPLPVHGVYPANVTDAVRWILSL